MAVAQPPLPARDHRARALLALSRSVRGRSSRSSSEFTPLIEPLSIDEAFLDVTGTGALFGPAPSRSPGDLKDRDPAETGLTASVGVAPNKFLAKLASDMESRTG